LGLLWEVVSSKDVHLSTAACQSVKVLAQDGKADFQFILNGFLNLVPTSK
jgi:hypothetical protein